MNEIAMLPAYCQLKRQFSLPNRPPAADVRQWGQALGPNVTMHLHHYCGGLAWLRRAEYASTGGRQREQYASKALSGIDYLLRAHNLPPDTPIMPDILVNRGKALFLRGEPGQAAEMARKALVLKGGTVAAHELLIDVHLSLRQKKEALQAAEEGLRRVPGARRLERRYIELGGKLPLPDMPETKSEPPVESPPAEAVVENAREPGLGGAAVPAEPSVPSDEGGQASPSLSATDAEEPPKKPRSCRFCP